jgi:DNA-binding transcriptional LysR family regulator
MDRLAAMQAFVRVVESGNFVRAAERLRLSTSSTSRLIADLEAHLGTRLLQRTTRRLSLTESGQGYYERCVQLLADLNDAESQAGRSAALAAGSLRLTCSYNMAVFRLPPLLAGFAELHPQIHFDLTVADRRIDLVDEGFDLAIRVGAVGGDQLVARRLGGTRLVLCGAPSYLKAHGTPRRIEDLAGHRLLEYAYSSTPGIWVLRDGEGQEHRLLAQGPIRANSGEALLAAAAQGMGLVLEPDFMVASALAAGVVVPVLPQVATAVSDIWAVYPTRRHLSAKVRLFVDYLVERFDAAPAAAPPGRRRARG